MDHERARLLGPPGQSKFCGQRCDEGDERRGPSHFLPSSFII